MSGSITAPSGARECSIEATVIRADGRVERLGRVAYWHKSPLKRLAWRTCRTLHRLGRAFASAIRAD